MVMDSQELFSYLSGLILGDGRIENGASKRAFRIKTIYKDFAEQMVKTVKENTVFSINMAGTPSSTDKDGVHHKDYWTVYIKAHQYFARLYPYFYNEFKERIIHPKIMAKLGWNGWANWYMSDGYVDRTGVKAGNIKCRGIVFCTDRYRTDSVEFMVNYMKEELNFNPKILKKNTFSYRVYLPLVDSQIFLTNVAEYIVPSMRYKLNLWFTEKPDWMTDAYYNLMVSLKQPPPDVVEEENNFELIGEE